MTEIQTKSTSRNTAQANDTVLRETESIRLIFRPAIVENSANPAAAVRGVFLYQRKARSDTWVDFETIPLTSVKSGEGFRLELRSEELLGLYQVLGGLYCIKSEQGVPLGRKRFVEVTPPLERLQQLSREDFSTALNANRALGRHLLTKLLAWAAALDDASTLVEKLLEVAPSSLAKLNAAIGLQRLREALATWDANRDNTDEEFWQRQLTENSFVLEHVFSWPASIVAGKAYVGGKSVLNAGGNLVDFLLRNRLTQSAALIEIKTPGTPLLGGRYRQTYNVSTELSGAVMQALNYRHSLQDNYRQIQGHSDDLFDSFDPQCAVIIGNTRQLGDRQKTKAFELFRHQFPGLAVIPFDELFDKARKLVELLEQEPNQEMERLVDEVPF
ncbi:Shedu immune nuclease family protein [Methylotetracoccus oryzae]|uniref:Shedu immune nuclease family protein n=1 Tax=Methylotetracoccus oryzae TaxID=1919059 RepID=UPI002E258350